MPRNRLMVPMVTTIDGRPMRATRSPLKAPQSKPDAEPDPTSAGVLEAGLRGRAHGGRGQRDDGSDREVDLS